MPWRQLLETGVRNFIEEHAEDDVRALALKNFPDPSWDVSLVLNQVKVRQKARRKSPEWHDTNGIIFPQHHDFEQCSSEACALYKASLVKGCNFIDLTAGTGIDSYYFSKRFSSGLCVEHDPVKADLLRHNMGVLKQAGALSCAVEILCEESCNIIENMSYFDFTYIDPQRRDNARKGLFRLSDCSPDILAVIPALREKSGEIMVKTSPLLDISQTIDTLGFVKAVHVVQWDGECKEVLYILYGSKAVQATRNQSKDADEPKITAVEIDACGKVMAQFSYTAQAEKNALPEYGMPQRYMYEPGPAFQKAGGFKNIAVHYGVKKIHPLTHLYTSESLCDSFPGKRYEVVDIVSPKAKFLDISKADIKLRNFPGSVETLRKKLKLAEGGNYRIYACTLVNEEKKLVICKKQ